MNKIRRKSISAVIGVLETAKECLEQVHDEEEDAFDNLPESFQESERGETMQEIIDSLDDVIETLNDLV